ncbi:hypothetical protein Q9233_001145 [Columba guinea]|nr:hypothetical protein Q9233_001145 [Columba guinea]
MTVKGNFSLLRLISVGLTWCQVLLVALHTPALLPTTGLVACTILLVLECPEDICCFQFSPSDPSIIAGGCINGQVLIPCLRIK